MENARPLRWSDKLARLRETGKIENDWPYIFNFTLFNFPDYNGLRSSWDLW
jgi:hypothetical protein